jgi:hypothetical protein
MAGSSAPSSVRLHDFRSRAPLDRASRYVEKWPAGATGQRFARCAYVMTLAIIIALSLVAIVALICAVVCLAAIAEHKWMQRELDRADPHRRALYVSPAGLFPSNRAGPEFDDEGR